jgi:hypothetical protein
MSMPAMPPPFSAPAAGAEAAAGAAVASVLGPSAQAAAVNNMLTAMTIGLKFMVLSFVYGRGDDRTSLPD